MAGIQARNCLRQGLYLSVVEAAGVSAGALLGAAKLLYVLC
jgi:hypothetical protein